MYATDNQGGNTLREKMVNWTKVLWIDVLLYKNKTSHYIIIRTLNGIFVLLTILNSTHGIIFPC